MLCLSSGVTGNCTPPDVKIFLEAGADFVCEKPLKIAEFTREVDRVYSNLAAATAGAV